MRRVLTAVLVLVLLLGAAVGSNFLILDLPIQAALKKDIRNSTVSFQVHWRNWVDPTSIVIDVRSVSSASMVDVDRGVLQVAEYLQSRKYSFVYLSSHGVEKFRLKGEYFQKIGQEYSFQNPMYTIRTFAENVQNLDGSNAFSHWEGGWLGVMNRQMEDHQTFHRRWWATDL